MILFISPKYGNKADSVKLIQAARKNNIRTNTLLNSWEKAKELSGNMAETAAPYGEHAFCEFLAQELGWNLYSNSLDWVARLPKPFLKRAVAYMTIENAMDLQYQSRAILNSKYLEPADDQCFKPGVYPARFPIVPKDTKIIVQDDVDWQVKYRFLIIKNKIESFCCYQVAKVFNDPSIYQTRFTGKNITAEAFMSTVLSHQNSAPACIIDVGYIKEEGWAVCGTYPVWTSELYGLDAEKFLTALFVACTTI